MTIKLVTEQYLELLSLKGGCTGSSESTLVKILHYWKSHVGAHVSGNNFVYINTLCMRAMKALANMRTCAGSLKIVFIENMR